METSKGAESKGPRSKDPRGKVLGLPQNLSTAAALKWVYPRVSEKRFKHIEGVVKIAVFLASEFGEDAFSAELAAWLHDACKEMKDKELLSKAHQYGIKVTEIEEQNGHLLHGPVAACTVRHELSLTNKEILDAISQHTLGAPNMAPLSKIIFLADCLEASRPSSYTTPIWNALTGGAAYILNEPGVSKDYSQDAVLGLATKPLSRTLARFPDKRLDESAINEFEQEGLTKGDQTKVKELYSNAAILVACDLNLLHLIESHKIIHPRTVEARNYYLKIFKPGNG